MPREPKGLKGINIQWNTMALTVWTVLHPNWTQDYNKNNENVKIVNFNQDLNAMLCVRLMSEGHFQLGFHTVNMPCATEPRMGLK